MALPSDQIRRLQTRLGTVGPDTISTLCTIGRQLAVRIDRLINLWERPGGVPVMPGAGPLVTTIGVAEMMALQLASYPRDHASVTVTNSMTPLVENAGARYIAVMVTNLDNAQRLFYGCGSVGVTSAPFIPGQDKGKIIVPPGEILYGIVSGASINVAVSTLAVPRIG